MAAHLLTLSVSLLTVVWLPLIASVETFGYWNLYILLTSFVYLLSFGLNDGILLRLGGQRFSELDWPLLSRLIATLGITTAAMAILFCLISASLTLLSTIMIIGIALSIPILLLNSFLSYILLATNRITKYALSIIIGRAVFIILFLGLLSVGPTLGSLIVADLIANAVSLSYVAWACRPIFRGPKTLVSGVVLRKELFITARSGLTLMIAGITAGATMGAVRLIVQAEWGIAVFAGLSLALSAANLLTSFLQAAATVIFPWLRSVDMSRIRQLHVKLHRLMSVFSVVVLACFFPMRWAIAVVFPQYVESVEFLFIVVPVVVCQARIALLVTPFLNALRKERTLLWVNLLGLLVSLLLALTFGFLVQDLLFTVMSMLFAQGFRMMIGELIVRRSINVGWGKALFFDTITIGAFIISATIVPGWWGALAFVCVAALVVLTVRIRERGQIITAARFHA